MQSNNEELIYAQSLSEMITLQQQIDSLALWHSPQIKQHVEMISLSIQEIQQFIMQSQQSSQGNQNPNNMIQLQQIQPKLTNQITQQNQNQTQKMVLKFDKKVESELQNAMKIFNFKIIDTLILQSDNTTQEKCIICIETLFDEQQNIQQIPVVQLQCSHFFHWNCIKNMIQGNISLKCPVCSSIQGNLTGDMPEGKMIVSTIYQKCQGYNCKTISIYYEFKPGKRNGKYYDGTCREAFLPDNKEGQEILALLKRSFDQKLTFTIGTSVTTGRDNQIVWNGIHHKTSLSGGPTNFGYPDPTYFDRVKQELKQKGIQ